MDIAPADQRAVLLETAKRLDSHAILTEFERPRTSTQQRPATTK